MEYEEREYLINKIDCGYYPVEFEGNKLYIHALDKYHKLEANRVYFESLNKAKEERLPDDVDVLGWLIDCGIWTEQNEEDFNKIPDNLNNLKKELFQSYFKSELKEKLLKYIEVTLKEYDRLADIRYSWNYLTDKGYASYCKLYYIVEHSIDSIFLDRLSYNDLLNIYSKNRISEDDIRNIAKNALGRKCGRLARLTVKFLAKTT